MSVVISAVEADFTKLSTLDNKTHFILLFMFLREQRNLYGIELTSSNVYFSLIYKK